MKAILLRRPGGPEALEYVEVPTPVPGEGKVLVKADTIGVSMPEVLVRRGTYAWIANSAFARDPGSLRGQEPSCCGAGSVCLGAASTSFSLR
jgi:NADPH:quinone reductase-like Zn-dependent oxidoreductase